MSHPPIRIGLVGMGKIARDQHVPAIAGDAAFALAATVSPHGAGVDGVQHFTALDAMLQAAEVDAVALCTPPQVRFELAVAAIAAGKHVFLEKPPGASLSEVAALEQMAAAAGVTLFASWHSRHAAGVEPARAWLAGKTIRRAHICWREDVRHWHPGQAWIWQAGGLGVFDPGINALSIATRIWPQPLYLETATLQVPANREAPIAADLMLRDAAGTQVSVDLDWRQTGKQTWDITVETDAGTLTLSDGGAVFSADGETRRAPDREYPLLYARFAELVQTRTSECDIAPLRLVADAFLRGQRETVEDFVE